MIKQLGIIINKNISEVDGYRTVPVMIRGAEHVPPRPAEVPQAMMYFVYNYERTQYDSIYEKMADMHLQYERIHPFADGNGRTGRLLLNYELLRHDQAPIVIPKDDRSRYFELLAACDEKGLAAFFEELEQEERKLLMEFGYDMEQRKEQEERKAPPVRKEERGPKL